MTHRFRIFVCGLAALAVAGGCAARSTPADVSPAPDAPADATPPLPPDAALAVDAATLPDADNGPCAVMRRDADETNVTNRGWPHLKDRSLERAIRRFYTHTVIGSGIDDRKLTEHPVVFDQGVTAPAAAVAACVGEWTAADPSGVVPGATGPFEDGHHYAEVTFEFNDASDGEYMYTVFVDVATGHVAAAFYYGNFQP
jgi:hypothetical protein